MPSIGWRTSSTITGSNRAPLVDDLNVDDFCKDAGRALLVLFRAFPRPLALFVEDVCGPDQPDEFGVHSQRHQACFSALLWLADEGLLRYQDTIRQEAVDQAVLTGRAFTLLAAPAAGIHAMDGAPPPRAGASSTRAHRLAEALAERSSSRIRQVLLELLQAAGLGGAARHA